MAYASCFCTLCWYAKAFAAAFADDNLLRLNRSTAKTMNAEQRSAPRAAPIPIPAFAPELNPPADEEDGDGELSGTLVADADIAKAAVVFVVLDVLSVELFKVVMVECVEVTLVDIEVFDVDVVASVNCDGARAWNVSSPGSEQSLVPFAEVQQAHSPVLLLYTTSCVVSSAIIIRNQPCCFQVDVV